MSKSDPETSEIDARTRASQRDDLDADAAAVHEPGPFGVKAWPGRYR